MIQFSVILPTNKLSIFPRPFKTYALKVKLIIIRKNEKENTRKDFQKQKKLKSYNWLLIFLTKIYCIKECAVKYTDSSFG